MLYDMGFSIVLQKRYEETKGPEWLWWFFTVGLVIFNLLLLVWFFLLDDYFPAILCCVAALTYATFFVYAKDDIVKLRVSSEGCVAGGRSYSLACVLEYLFISPSNAAKYTYACSL